MKLRESSIPQMFSQMLTAKRSELEIDATYVPFIFEVAFVAFSDMLRLSMGNNKKVAILVEDVEGFQMAAMVTSHENEDKNMPGNYSYEFTFDKEDTADADVVHKISDNNFIQIISLAAYSKYGMKFNADHYVIDLLMLMVKSLKEWLDLNASETEKVVLEHDGYFKASVEVENGEKLFSLTPSGEMKKLIKNDASKEM